MYRLSLLLLLVISAGPAHAQDSTRTDEAVRVYLDCGFHCDFQYIQNQIPWVNHVRDRESAQVHVLVTSQRTAGGGESINLSFIGRGEFAGQDHTLNFISEQGESQDIQRQGFTRILKMGLMRYIAQTSFAKGIDISYRSGDPAVQTRTPRDPWNNWVFRFSLGTNINKEESFNSLSLNGNVSADRVTERWKWQNGVSYSSNVQNFKGQNDWIRSSRRNGSYGTTLVYSLSERWSAGGFTSLTTSTYNNTLLGLSVAPAIEYNFFPWKVSDRKMLTVQYRAGVQNFDYEERTLYGKTQETLTYQSLAMGLGLKQPWGEVSVNLEGMHYFHDWTKRRLQLFTNLDIRITKGLSLDLFGYVQRIQDQLYLPAGSASLEEILLRRRRLATSYEIYGSVSLRYTFGSIYNNVVNLRL